MGAHGASGPQGLSPGEQILFLRVPPLCGRRRYAPGQTPVFGGALEGDVVAVQGREAAAVTTRHLCTAHAATAAAAASILGEDERKSILVLDVLPGLVAGNRIYAGNTSLRLLSRHSRHG